MKFIPLAIVILAGSIGLQSTARADCAGLVANKIPNTEIVKAEPVGAGAFVPPPHDWGAAIHAAIRGLPAFCRVIGVLRPTVDSEIGFELWLPHRWNGRYLQVGNGGFAGGISYLGLIQGLQNGFAAASTDDGHVGDDTAWMFGHPEKLIDYGYRAVHSTRVASRQIVGTYYIRPAHHSYFSGCSDGGRESLMEAQRYPDDFDGWIVGAPGNDWLGLMVLQLHKLQLTASLKGPLTHDQLKALGDAALSHCDSADGIKDGVIADPLECSFDPGELECKGTHDGRCLSKTQVEFARRVYDDVRAQSSGASLAPGMQGTRGNEAGTWDFPKLPEDGSSSSNGFAEQIAHGFWPKMVYMDPRLDYWRIDLLDAVKKGNAYIASIVNSVSPDLSVLRASGKKIIQYHGWADTAIPAQYSIAYYEAVEKYLRQDNRDFYRLFLAPGMFHCGAGPGPNVFGGAYTPGGVFDPDHHALAALVRWVEKGKAPQRIVATKYQDDDPAKSIVRTRPLCVYPLTARWTGKNSTDEAANFTCD